MILIFTNKQDTHTDEVIKSLGRRGIEVFRLNSEDLILKYRIEVLTDNSGNWHGTIEDETNRVLNLDAIRVAWLRKPDFDFATTDDASTEVQDFIYSETKTFIQLLYSLPNITWINDPFIANKSKVKFQQLLLAAKFGVSIPKTLVTNRPSAAQKFFLNCGETALTKAIYTGNVTIDGINQGIPSKQINKQEFYDHLDNISLCVTQ